MFKHCIFSTFLTAVLGLVFYGCGKENAHDCCSIPPVFEKFGNATLFLPNIFSPNADGLNDRFLPDGGSLSNLTISIKHGSHLVFETTKGLTEIWNGAGDAEGKYTFTWQAISADGQAKNGSGEVCLVRESKLSNCTSCGFNNQFDGNAYDPDRSNGELICE